MLGVRTARALSFGVFILFTAVFAFAFLPLSEGAALPPPKIDATLTGVQLDDRISYTLLLENTGSLPATSVTIDAYLPPGLALADGSGSHYGPILVPKMNAGDRVQLQFTATIEPGVAAGTVAVVDAFISFHAGGSQEYTSTAQSSLSVAARGGIPLLAFVGALAAGVLLAIGYAGKVHAEGVRIDQLFLLHDSGMLIRHYSNGHGVQKDSDIMSGMLIVLQEFVRDSFNDQRSTLEEVRFGDKRVLMARGDHSIIAAIVRGKRLNGLPSRLQRALGEFETAHLDALRHWNGNLETMTSADSALESLVLTKHRRFAPT